MTLHIFNPEHDIALASGLKNFTAPHAGRQLRYDLGWLPALYADKGDLVLVENLEKAIRGTRFMKVNTRRFISNVPSSSDDRKWMDQVTHVEPWGWDAAVRRSLTEMGVDEGCLPSPQEIEVIRQLSHRRTAAQLLTTIKEPGMAGEAFECSSTDEVHELLKSYGRLVVKAPWSSSGRGVRFLSSEDVLQSPSFSGWLRNTLSAQGTVMTEPYYNKVKDFGMEFTSDGQGSVSFEGLSLFHTSNGAYTGNLIATEQAKREQLNRYIPIELIDHVQQNICTYLGDFLRGKYRGPFGIDMMIVAADGSQGSNILHPCVEVNLRRTMGHVALALQPLLNPENDNELLRAMHIDYNNNNYKLRIKRL